MQIKSDFTMLQYNNARQSVQSSIDAHAAISNMPPYGVTRRITVLPVSA